MGAIAFFLGVMQLIWLVAVNTMPPKGSPSAATRFRFTIRDLMCLAIFVFGMTMFLVSAFKCEAAERASKPKALPAVAYRQFVWEQESGLVFISIGGLIWIYSALERTKK